MSNSKLFYVTISRNGYDRLLADIAQSAYEENGVSNRTLFKRDFPSLRSVTRSHKRTPNTVFGYTMVFKFGFESLADFTKFRLTYL